MSTHHRQEEIGSTLIEWPGTCDLDTALPDLGNAPVSSGTTDADSGGGGGGTFWSRFTQAADEQGVIQFFEMYAKNQIYD